MNAPFTPAKPSEVNIIIGGRSDDPKVAAQIRAALDRLCEGAPPIEPRPRIDWSKSKQQNIADAIARIDAAFGRGVGQ